MKHHFSEESYLLPDITYMNKDAGSDGDLA